MYAWLYTNNSDERVVDKNLTVLHPINDEPQEGISCIFKDDTDLIHPTIIFNYAIVPYCNYIWLSEPNRYYYVRNRTYSQGRVYLECEEDVLYTYRNELRQREVVLKRSQYIYNQDQEDDEWKTYGYTAVRTINFPSGFSDSTQEFILGIAGGNSNS